MGLLSYRFEPFPIRVENRTDGPFTFDSAEGSDWQVEGRDIEPGQDSGEAFVFKAPTRVLERRWGWLAFTYHPPSSEAVQFRIYCHFKDADAADTHGACIAPHGSWDNDNPLPTRSLGSSTQDTQSRILTYTFTTPSFASRTLSGPNWMTSFSTTHPPALHWPLPHWHLPGSHDTATYGSGTFPTNAFKWNWNCQSDTVLTQLRSGARFLDLRFGLENDGKWWPCHGIAYKTGDRLETSNGVNEQAPSILGQILEFVKGVEGEVVVLNLAVNTERANDSFWRPVLEALREVAFAVNGGWPTVERARSEGKRVMIFGAQDEGVFGEGDPMRAVFRDLVWRNREPHWLGSPYTDEDWQTIDPNKPIAYTETWMGQNNGTLERTGMWNAQCQLTPPGLPPPPPDPAGSPSRLAAIMNPWIKQNLLTRQIWLERANIMMVDFIDEDIAMALASMNFSRV